MSDFLAPYEKLLILVSRKHSPEQAANTLAAMLGHVWESPAALPEAAPAHYRAYIDELAMTRRFSAATPDSRELACAHYLYRAAASLNSLNDVEASVLLMEFAAGILHDVLLRWLAGRECPHCKELRFRLEEGGLE